MDSPTPPYLDKQLKRSRLFQAGTYKGVPMRIQKQAREVVRETGQTDIITMETICLIDWVDLSTEPVYGDAIVVGPKAYTVRSYILQSDGFARIELDNA